MGEQKVSLVADGQEMQSFVKKLLRDVRAFEHMLENDWFESDTIRIGAEQEMCLIDSQTYKPSPIAVEALDKLKRYPWAESELARFNLETTLSPQLLKGKCFSKMEAENRKYLDIIGKVVGKMGAEVILTGILPTFRKHDLEMHNLMPKKRYHALMEALHGQLIGNSFELRLMGIDELLVRHNSPLLEACNTSFQVHLQVKPKEFVPLYNIAQVLAAPVMAIGANSPLVFGRRLWHESRIAMFQQAIDVRTTTNHLRERSPRVSFGSDWLDNSIMEIFREDISRFRVLLSADVEEDSLAMIAKGKTPKLRALQVHNGTVYRWNRPCYGISPNGQPHLRIENRVLPAGPTVIDEMANAAFWIGAMVGMQEAYPDIRKEMIWEDARDNFAKAAKFGIDTQFTWLRDKKISACDLVTKELLPLAEAGLKARKVDSADIDLYLGIIKQRAKKKMNGARWQLRAFTKLKKEASQEEALAVLSKCMIDHQRSEKPVHHWPMPNLSTLKDYRPNKMKVDEFMSTDLITVQKNDIIELVADIMDWRKIRYMPVEDSKGKLSGLVTMRKMMRFFAQKHAGHQLEAATVKDIMIEHPHTVHPDASLLEAMDLMRTKKVGCLPVVQDDGELVGIITEMDFLRVSTRLLERLDQQ